MRVFLAAGDGRNVYVFASDCLGDGFEVCGRSDNIELVLSLTLLWLIHEKGRKNQAEYKGRPAGYI
jgi:hypothetical protein